MTTKQALTWSLLILAGCAAYSAYIYANMPPIIPIHWNIEGHIDGYGAKGMSVGMLLLLDCIPAFSMLILPKLSSKLIDKERFEKVVPYVCLLVTVFCAFVNVMVLYVAQHPEHPFSFSRAITIGSFILLALMGNVLGKLPRNRWFGIRTHWTMASDSVWAATNRMAARLMVILGILGAVLLMLGGSLVVSVALFIAMTMMPVVYSYVLFKREAGNGHAG